MARQIVGFLILLGIAILLVILVVRLIFGGGSGTQTATPERLDLASYASTSKHVRLTIEGPVVADQLHRQARIDISRDRNEIAIIQGYQGTVIDRQTFANNQSAYGVFLRAVDLQGFTQGVDDEALRDSRGRCPTGSIYTFDILDGDKREQSYWASSCGENGTSRAKVSSVLNLFQAQIPEYNQITAGVNF